MAVYKSASELIGNTPLIELTGVKGARVLAKLEFLNPAGSVKDRVALSMVEDAEHRGLLKEGSVIIEPTSGNTGIGLACVAASRNYRTIIVMPDSMSVERQTLMKAYGAEVCRARLIKQKNWHGRSPAALSPTSLLILLTRMPTGKLQVRRSGGIRKGTWIFL